MVQRFHGTGVHVYLKVDVLQAFHGHVANRIRHLEVRKVFVGSDDKRVESDFIFQAIKILAAVGLDVLKRLCKLAIQPVHQAKKRALNVNS